MKSIEMLEKFLNDENGWEMFITGPAGTGKTTQLKKIIEWLEENKVNYVVTAFTHKACDVIKERTGTDKVQTLHSFLKVVPMPNEEALSQRRIKQTAQVKKPSPVKLLIIDEFSMISDRDIARIEELQDPNYEGIPQMKVLYIGDLNQLPPVDSEPAVYPKEPYWIKLTKVYRQGKNNKLLDVLLELNKMIQGEIEPHYIEPNDNFIRNVDLVKEWKEREGNNIILAYTNEQVQYYNFLLKGAKPIEGEEHFCPSLHHYVEYRGEATYIEQVRTRQGDLPFNSKYKTLEYLMDYLAPKYNIKFGEFYDKDEEELVIYPYIFGHYNYKVVREALEEQIVNIQKEIKRKYNPASISHWCKANAHNELARKRTKAWRDYLTFNDCVVCIDHNIATTVHKSQGSTFDNVFIDGEDLGKCSDINLMLKLYYVAISRAKYKAFINN